MGEITHRTDEDGILRQIVPPRALRAVLDAEGSDYSRPDWLAADDEWDVGDEPRRSSAMDREVTP